MMKKGKHSILFICLGNICRSPAAEGIMKALVKKAGREDEFYIDSAAIGPWHIGQLPDARMRRCGAKHGYQFDSHARQFSAQDFDRFDLIVVMDEDNYKAISRQARTEEDKAKIIRIADYLSAAHCQHYSTVPDPYYGNEEDFELVITLLEDALARLLENI